MGILTLQNFLSRYVSAPRYCFFANVVRFNIFLEVAQEIRLENVYSDSEAGLLNKKNLRLKIFCHSPFKSCEKSYMHTYICRF
jgi:hypothetical protein